MSNKDRLDAALFDLQFKTIEPCFAWLYLVDYKPIICYADTAPEQASNPALITRESSNINHAGLIEWCRSSTKVEIIKHGISGYYPLGLSVRYGCGTLAVAKDNTRINRIKLFLAIEQ
jgi:hypothetical protein